MVAISIIRNKYLAFSIGPEGFGMFNLISSFFIFMGYFTGSWLQAPTIKYIAEYNSDNDKEAVQKVFDFSFSITVILTLMVFILVLLFANYIINNFLSSEISIMYYSLFAASFLGTRLTSVFQSMLQGLKMVKETVKIRILSNIINFFIIVVLVCFFDLLGFFVSIFVSAFFLLFLFWRDSKGLVEVRVVKPNLKESISKKMVAFAKVNIFLGFLNQGSEYLRRFIIVNLSNMSVLGLFQASFGLTKYLGIISNGAVFYYKPKMSENLNIEERNKTLNDYLRIILLTGVLFSTIAILFGRIAIKILYAKSFLPLANVFYIFVIAQLMVSIQLAFQGIIVGMAKLKIHSLTTTIAHILMVVIPLFLIKKYGLLSVGLGAVIASAQHIAINFTYLRRKIGIKVSLENMLLILLTILFIGISTVMESVLIYYKIIVVLLLSVILFFSLKENEKKFILNYIKTKTTLIGKK